MNNIVIEIVKNQTSFIKNDVLIQITEEYLRSNDVYPGTVVKQLPKPLCEHVKCLIIEECEHYSKIDFTNLEIKWYIYSLNEHGGQNDYLQNENEGDQGDIVTLSTNWMIPSADFHESWENLIYDSQIKPSLLKYVSTMMIFSDKGVNSNIVCSNRVVLLHGPPGTGKTSLCRALAHKLSIRLQHRFSHGHFIEINSHSLFSKWFSESGKLVTKMFSRIYDLVDNPKLLVCVLIDEVESLAHARTQCISGSEPSDAIRVVNAVLTQIDQIKKYPNVLILTTSNMTAAIDLAFVDRADIKQYIGLPSIHAIYKIYHSCLQELMRTEIIVPSCAISSELKMVKTDEDLVCENSKVLVKICEKSVGFSGRTLRKVPFLAHALYTKIDTVPLCNFLISMDKAVEYLKKEKEHFVNL